MVNQGTILGRVGKLDIKNTTTGMKIANISIVTSKKYTKDGEKKEKATWHNVSAFSKLAEIIEKYVTIGDLLYVQGEMDNQKYTDKDGQERMKHFVIAHEIKLMPKSKEHQPAPKEKSYDEAFADNDIPW